MYKAPHRYTKPNHRFSERYKVTLHTFVSLLIYILILPGCSSAPNKDTPDKRKAGREVANIAESLIGVPYRYGGSSLKGFDCSGFIYYVFDKTGIAIPRTTEDQFRLSERRPLEQARTGDLLFFRINSRKLSHVALYIGDGRFIHASTSKNQVTTASLDNPYWRNRLISVGRLYLD